MLAISRASERRVPSLSFLVIVVVVEGGFVVEFSVVEGGLVVGLVVDGGLVVVVVRIGFVVDGGLVVVGVVVLGVLGVLGGFFVVVVLGRPGPTFLGRGTGRGAS